MERKAGEAEGPAVAMTSPMEGVDPPDRPRRTEGATRHRSEDFLPLPYLQKLPAWSSGGFTGGQRRRLLRDVNGACRALNWMHGEENRPTALHPSLVASEDKNQ